MKGVIFLGDGIVIRNFQVRFKKLRIRSIRTDEMERKSSEVNWKKKLLEKYERSMKVKNTRELVYANNKNDKEDRRDATNWKLTT